MQHPTTHIIKQSLSLAAKWRSHKATWARVVTITSILHVFMFYGALVRTMYSLKFTITCSTFDYRYSIYVLFLNLVALWPICPATEKDARGRVRTATIEEKPMILCSGTNLVTSFLAVPATSVCFWYNLLSPLDFSILLAGHLFAVTAVFVHRCYAKCSTIVEAVSQQAPAEEQPTEPEQNAEEVELKKVYFPNLSNMKPIRKKWFRIGYLMRIVFLVLTYSAYINIPSTGHSCPVHPAATYLSHTASLTLLLSIMNELADDDCKYISVFRNVVNRRQYVIFGFHRSGASIANYKFHIHSALIFVAVALILFMFNFLTTADFFVTAAGSASWMILHTLSCACFTKFYNQVVLDHIKKYNLVFVRKNVQVNVAIEIEMLPERSAASAEEGLAAEEATDEPETMEEEEEGNPIV